MQTITSTAMWSSLQQPTACSTRRPALALAPGKWKWQIHVGPRHRRKRLLHLLEQWVTNVDGEGQAARRRVEDSPIGYTHVATRRREITGRHSVVLRNTYDAQQLQLGRRADDVASLRR